MIIRYIKKLKEKIDLLEKEKQIHVKLEHQYKKEYLDAKERIEQLEKENEEIKYDNATLEKQVKLMRDNFTIAVEQQVNQLLGGKIK